MKKAVTRNLLAALGACALLSAGAVLAKGPAGGKGPPPFDCKVELQSPQQCATEFHVIWNPEVSPETGVLALNPNPPTPPGYADGYGYFRNDKDRIALQCKWASAVSKTNAGKYDDAVMVLVDMAVKMENLYGSGKTDGGTLDAMTKDENSAIPRAQACVRGL